MSLHGLDHFSPRFPVNSGRTTPDAASLALGLRLLSVSFLISTEAKRGRDTLVLSSQNRVLVPWKFVSLNHFISLAMIIIN